jgi:DNA-binding NarL/FixJ family response regulator
VLAKDLDTAESAFATALSELDPADGPIEHGLIRLDHGRWLRRAGQRRAAREVLQQAHADFTGSGATALAEIAAREIGATAARLRPRTNSTGDELTTRETEIAQRAATGATDRDIAATLYISTRTVDYHLRNIFRKLGIRSRAELAPLLQRGDPRE